MTRTASTYDGRTSSINELLFAFTFLQNRSQLANIEPRD